jgi:hypothetical protein
MKKYFPQCPICLENKGYDVLGANCDYISCKKCSTTWRSDNFKTCQVLNTLMLTQNSPKYNLTGKVQLNKNYPTAFWQNWREKWQEEQEREREREIQALEGKGENAIDCQFLKEGNCLSIVNNQEALTSRKTTCGNENDQACCYICDLYEGCEISCNYLGENKAKQKEIKAAMKITRCPLCGSRMLHSEVKLRIGGWSGALHGLPLGDLGELSEELLPVEMYVCVRCGKMELMALKETKDRIIHKIGGLPLF